MQKKEAGSQPRKDSLQQGGAEEIEGEEVILVKYGETGPLVVARDIEAFPAVSVRECSIANYVNLTSTDETTGKNKVVRKCLSQT